MTNIQILFAASLIAACSGAHAGEYTTAAQKQSKCEAAGELAQSFYGKTTGEFRAQLAEIDGQAKAKKISKNLATDTKYILFMGKIAKSEKAAYMEAWAWCMDNR
jgi:hypothetical protein